MYSGQGVLHVPPGRAASVRDPGPFFFPSRSFFKYLKSHLFPVLQHCPYQMHSNQHTQQFHIKRPAVGDMAVTENQIMMYRPDMFTFQDGSVLYHTVVMRSAW